MWILSKMRFSECEFWENCDFSKVNFPILPYLCSPPWVILNCWSLLSFGPCLRRFASALRTNLMKLCMSHKNDVWLDGLFKSMWGLGLCWERNVGLSFIDVDLGFPSMHNLCAQNAICCVHMSYIERFSEKIPRFSTKTPKRAFLWREKSRLLIKRLRPPSTGRFYEP